MEILDVKPLLRFKAVSKQWKSTIESRFFQRQLIHRQQTRDPDVLMLSLSHNNHKQSLTTLVLGSSSSSRKIPIPLDNNTYYELCPSSCDGLVCLYHHQEPGFVVNPTTRWYRPLPPPLSKDNEEHNAFKYYKLGFGKDKFTCTYKPVWLYNSIEIGLEKATKCQVFDFSNNAWRYVTPSSPYLVQWWDPIFVDGSLHWFTNCKETKILSFDLHTEVFQVISKAPFTNAYGYEAAKLCNLDNRLCVSLERGSNRVIWSFNTSNNTWGKMCSIDVDLVVGGMKNDLCQMTPLALVCGEKKKKNKLLFYYRKGGETVATYDHETKSYDVAFSAKSYGYATCYIQSLISIL